MQLRELQQQFLNGIYQQETPILRLLANDKRPAIIQFEIYRNSILGGMCKALGEIYPVCKQLVGTRFFDAMALRYAKTHRATSADLTEYGSSFAEFITNFPPADAVPYLGDMARLEWAWHLAFNAADPDQATLPELRMLPQDRLSDICLGLSDTASLLASTYPLHRIWLMHQPECRIDNVSLDEGSIKLLIWRPGLDVYIEPLEEATWYLLTACLSGSPLGQIFGEMPESIHEKDLQQALIEGFQRGYFHSFTLKR